MIESLGARGDGLSLEIWWSPNHPLSSSLTGRALGSWPKDTARPPKRPWTQLIGFKHALFEVTANVIQRAVDLDDNLATVEAIRNANLPTIVGPVDWSIGPVKNVTKTTLVAGQWQGGEGNFDLVITANKTAPEIPVGGELLLL